MATQPACVVTGAFGYSGKYIAQQLLTKGFAVKTLTNSPKRRNPFADQLDVSPYYFDEPAKLALFMNGASVLYNTYWVRFNHPDFTFSQAVRNSRILFEAARLAGVKRIVHVSITNPSLESPLEYFRGKALVEKALVETGIPHTILRPAVLFGGEDILINNIAWALRIFPVFGVFGDGAYRLQPIHVEDFAQAAVDAGEHSGNEIINAIGPETYTYRELVQMLGQVIAKPRRIISVPPSLGYAAAVLLGKIVSDVMLTRDEIDGLMADLLHVDAPPLGLTSLRKWATRNAHVLGRYYAGEICRRKDRFSDYNEL